MSKGSNSPSGATLLDVVLALALVALATAVALPRFRSLLDSIAVRGAASEAHVLFGAARHLALSRAAPITVELDAAGAVMIVRDGPDTLRRRDLGAVHQVRMSASRSSMTYAANGVGYGASNLTLILSRGRVADTLTVSRLGRVKR